jgi:alkylation response protein AidB-like acyl-CoA dehydrogenase
LRECTPELLREIRDGGVGHSPELWEKIASLGWIGLPFEERYGGGGASLIDVAVICEEAGRFLLPTTYESTLFAGFAIASIGTEVQKDTYLPAIVRGDLVATIAAAETGVIDDLARVTTAAHRTPDGWLVNGTKTLVPHLNVADLVVFIARARSLGTADNTAAFLTMVPNEGVQVKPLQVFGSINLGDLLFDGCRLEVDAMLVGSPGELGETLARFSQVKRTMIALKCISMVGGTERTLDSILDYVQDRVQFDASIGTFQSVQHRIADCRIALDAARVATNQAIWSLSIGRSAVREVAVAKILANKAFKMTTLAGHQYFGGMGFMTESDLYLWSERAKADELVLGSSAEQLAALVNSL